MTGNNEIKIQEASEELLANHLFNPTNKSQWINDLSQNGLTEDEAKKAFKLAATKYHAHRNALSNKKTNFWTQAGKMAGYAGAGYFTFFVGPWIYLALVLLVITILGFLFDF